MSTKQENKFLKFLKANIYYILVILALAIMILVVSLSSAGDSKVVNTEVENNQEEITDVSSPNVVNYRVPLENFTILKEYNETDLMFNASLNRWEAHKSIDLSANEGASVMAIADGTVTQVYSNYLEGTVVVIEHSNGIKSLYGSLQENVNVSIGSAVQQGDIIGTVGCTAKAEHMDICHLHFELFRDGVKVNPAEYIPFTDK